MAQRYIAGPAPSAINTQTTLRERIEKPAKARADPLKTAACGYQTRRDIERIHAPRPKQHGRAEIHPNRLSDARQEPLERRRTVQPPNEKAKSAKPARLDLLQSATPSVEVLQSLLHCWSECA